MEPYLSREEILRKYYTLDVEDVGYGIKAVLLFVEGGRAETVFEYNGEQEALSLWEDDALMHWMKVLRRGWAEPK